MARNMDGKIIKRRKDGGTWLFRCPKCKTEATRAITHRHLDGLFHVPVTTMVACGGCAAGKPIRWYERVKEIESA